MPTPEQIIQAALPLDLNTTRQNVIAQRILRKLDAAGFEVVPKREVVVLKRKTDE